MAPPLSEAKADLIFQALAHAQRRRILDIVRANPGCTVSDVVKEFDTSRIAVMKHLNVLYDADLVIHEKIGRSRYLYLNVIPIQLIYDRWSDQYGEFWGGKLADIKYAVESQQQKRGKTK